MFSQTSTTTAFRNARALASDVASVVVDTVLPAQCISCFNFTSMPARLCANCWDELSHIDHPLCDRTGIPFAFDPGEGIVSASALARPPIWNRARAAVEFNTMSRKLIHALKYYDRHEVAEFISQAMTRAGGELLQDADMLIPVPLYPTRLWKRRFNQSGLLAKQIGNTTSLPYRPDILKRYRATRQQVELKGAARRDNVKGAFEVDASDADKLYGAKVVIVDDVITTGATVGACTQALLDAGCEQVDVLAFALVNNPLRLQI